MKLLRFAEIIKWLVISLAVSTGLCYTFYNNILVTNTDQINEVLKTLIALYGTLLGFVLTLMAIVLSLSGKPIFKGIVNSGHYLNLHTSSKILSFLYFMSLCIFVVTLAANSYKPMLYLTSIFSSITVAVYSLRTAYKFFQVFKHVDPNLS